MIDMCGVLLMAGDEVANKRARRRAQCRATQETWKSRHPNYRDEANLKAREKYAKDLDASRRASKLKREANSEKLKAQAKQRRLEDPERFKRRGRKWRLSNPEKVKQAKLKWARDNPEGYRMVKQRTYFKHVDKNRARGRSRWWTHREECRESKRKWRELNREKLNAQRRERRRNDLRFKIRINLSSRLAAVLRRASSGKGGALTMKLLGCSIPELVAHLEARFLPGMSWENYGQFHIDHIRPCASFDLTDPAQQRECFHYTNLQPLWAKDNMSKGAKWLTPAPLSVS